MSKLFTLMVLKTISVGKTLVFFHKKIVRTIIILSMVYQQKHG